MSDALSNGTGRAHGMLPADVAAVHSGLAGDMFTLALNCEDRGRGGPVGFLPPLFQ